MNSDRTTIYFASDFHLGVPDHATSRARENEIVAWLDMAMQDAAEIFLVGDVFDFWFEYKHCIPKGFIRLQGKLAEIVDAGIDLHIFTGNHDMWMFGYFEQELGVKVIREPIEIERQGKKLFIGHGDGLGPGDHKYKMIKRIFASRLCQWLFARIHPNLGMGVANYWSRKSRLSNHEPEVFKGREKEWLVQFCESQIKVSPVDYFVFGHRHVPIDHAISDSCRYINLGEWIHSKTFGRMKNGQLELLTWPDQSTVPPV